MALNLIADNEKRELKPRITVFGVGGAGGNAVNNMIEKSLEGVDFVVANTDAQALQQSKAPNRVQIGLKVTEGLGAGARPHVGASAAEETIEEVIDHLAGTHMCFITAGMGGGTGTGAAPIIAQAARELGVLTVGVVTKPFQFEGGKRMRQAEEGLDALQQMVDTLIVIPNQNLFRLANERTTFTDAFAMADDVLYQGVKGVTDLMVRPGLINLDFADVRSVMDEMGKAMMGTGEASGEERAMQAAEKAIANPLLDEISLNGAKGVLINVTGGYDMTLFELDEAANIIREKVDPEANIIIGSTLDPSMEGALRVSVVATGIEADESVKPRCASPELSRQRNVVSPVRVNGAVDMEASMSSSMPFENTAEARGGFDGPHGQSESLFSSFEIEETDAVSVSRDQDTEVAKGSDELPPPAYSVASAERHFASEGSKMEDMAMQPDSCDVATPAPEVLARLRAAVEKEPLALSQEKVNEGQDTDARHRIEASSPSGSVRSRFGIGSIINRMAGGGATSRVPPVVGQGGAHDHSATSCDDDGVGTPEQDRIEIPAFLRRQAN